MNETNNASDDEANAFALVFIYFTEQVKWLDTTDYLIVNYHDEKCRFPYSTEKSSISMCGIILILIELRISIYAHQSL